MANSELPEHLQFHGQAQETGCLAILSEQGQGMIYLHAGNVVHAEAGSRSGVLAFFMLLALDQPKVTWTPGRMSSRMTFSETIDTLLFQFAQLEDASQTDEAALTSLFGQEQDANEEIKLSDFSNMSVTFEVLNTDFKGFIFYLSKPVTLVGRVEDCDVILPDSSVSSHHCRMHLEQNCVFLEDLGSTNGSFVNGKLISKQPMQNGDMATIGSVEMRMTLKMQRRLGEDSPAHAMPDNALASAPLVQHTAPVSAPRPAGIYTPPPEARKTVPGAKKTTGRIKGPITWKNINPEEAKAGNSLWEKMFKKK
jgi:pSer/pThr/pTyr-binding forkhead associated (FHA) protein